MSEKQQWYLQKLRIQTFRKVLLNHSILLQPPMSTLFSSTDTTTMDWKTLEEVVTNCTACPLHQSRTHAVFGSGSQRANLLIVGEAPGANEDQQGKPFVGRAGQLLNAMLQAIGLTREAVYVTNILKSRPPQNRNPLPAEIKACTPYLLRQITLLKPKIILTLGRIATHYLLDTKVAMNQLRGQQFTYGPLNTTLIVTYHPAYLLRAPHEKRKAWEDMQLLQKLMQQ